MTTPPVCTHRFLVGTDSCLCSAEDYRHLHGACRACGAARTFRCYFPAKEGDKDPLDFPAYRPAPSRIGRGRPKLTEEARAKIVAQRGQKSQQALAKEFGISRTTVGEVQRAHFMAAAPPREAPPAVDPEDAEAEEAEEDEVEGEGEK